MADRGRVAVIGSANLDLTISAQRVPDRGETILGTSYTEYPGGKGFNQAAGAARAAPTFLVAMLGEDDAAARLREALAEAEVNDTAVEHVDTPTGRAIIHLTDDGDNRITVIQGANLLLKPQEVTTALDQISPAVVLTQLETPLSCAEAAHAWTVARGRRWILNPSPVTTIPRPLVTTADPLIVNEHEARAILRQIAPTITASDLSDVAESLSRYCRSVIVTAGSNGAYVATEAQTPTHIPGVPVAVADTTGAGDEFAGRIAAELAGGASLHEASIRAVKAAAKIVATPRTHRNR